MTSTRRPTHKIAAGLLAAASLAALAPIASAQVIKKEVKVDAPTPGREDADRPFLTHWLIMIGIIAAIIGVNCIPPKRGHQD
jgi:hypothetical protein